MNYAEPGSPAPSTPSSGSPPPDEIPEFQPEARKSQSSSFPASNSGSSKRRLPGGGAFSGSSNTRDTKTRRREGGGNRGQGAGAVGSGTGSWVEGKEGKQKEELVDSQLAEKLKKDFGDLFDDSIIKNVS